jgi:uncharacterized OsmC-like protein
MAKTTISTEVQWAGLGVQSTARVRQHEITIDEPVAWGGTDQGANPVELVLAGLGGCINVLLTSFAPLYQVELSHVTITIEGDLDPEGFMGVNPAVRPGFSEIRYAIALESHSPTDRITALVEHVERVCPVKDTLSGVEVLAQPLHIDAC